MVIQGGEVVDQRGDFDTRIDAYSARTSLISALCGIYSSEEAIDVNQILSSRELTKPPDPRRMLSHLSSFPLLLECTFQEKHMNCNRNFPTPPAVGRISQQR